MAGSPHLFHEYDFAVDPHKSQQLSPQFQAANGHRGSKLIAFFGTGGLRSVERPARPAYYHNWEQRNNILGKTNSLYIIKKFDWFIHETFFSYSDIFFILLIDKIRERKTFPWFRILIIWNDKGQYASSASSGITYGAFSFGEHQTVQTVKAKRKNSSADLERDADSILSFPLEKKRDKNQQSGHQSTTKTTTRLSLETGRLKTF
jgi:hypothetical protein